MSGIRWTEDELKDYLARDNRVAVQTANVERNPKHEPAAEDESQKIYPRVCIRFHSKRRRSIDPDGLYSKAAIDGLREAGLLVDDSAKYVESVSYSQEISEIEETIITVEVLNR